MLQSVVLALLALLATAAWLAQARSTTLGGLFLAGALPVWLVVLAIAWRIGRQESSGPGVDRPLGPATQLTLARGFLLSALAGFIPLAGRTGDSLLLAWLPGLLYTTAALADLVDGYLARRWGEESAVGARLDVAMDALGLVVAPLTAVSLGRLPAFYLLVGATYYLFHFGLWWRRRQGRPAHLERLKPSRVTRMYAGYQMGLVATVLFPLVGPPGTTLVAALFMIPNLTLFLRDWLVVTDRLDPAGPGHTRFLAAAALIAREVMPVVRLLAGAAIVAAVTAGQLHPAHLILAAVLVLGLATRTSAYAGAVLLTLVVAPPAGTPLQFAALFLMLLSLLGGGGRFALLPDDRWLLARAGEGPADAPPAAEQAGPVVASGDGGNRDLRNALPVVEKDRR